jgi:hypothetical protein
MSANGASANGAIGWPESRGAQELLSYLGPRRRSRTSNLTRNSGRPGRGGVAGAQRRPERSTNEKGARPRLTLNFQGQKRSGAAFLLLESPTYLR